MDDHRGHRSVSQIEQFSNCGLAYYLQRVKHVETLPAWWNIGGTAGHATLEEYERKRLEGELMSPEDARDRFHAHFSSLVGELSTEYPDKSTWLKANRDTEDEDFWWMYGPEVIREYILLESERNWETFVFPDGTPGIEWPFSLNVDGIEVQGRIDHVIYYPQTEDIVVRDFKFGRFTPSDTFQLGVYAHAIRQHFGIEPEWADYFMVRKTKAGFAIHPLELHPWEDIVYRTHGMDRLERVGVYLPRPSFLCGTCSHAPHCPVQNPEAARPPLPLALSLGTE